MKNVIIEHLTQPQIDARDILSWPIWEKEVSRFNWHYEAEEQCYILKGEVVVTTTDGEYHIQAGDFVTFKKDLSCVWDIKKAIRKHYSFR